MYSFVLAGLLFLILSIVSLIITYYVVVLLNQKQITPEPAINATIATNVLLLINYVSDVLSDTVDIVTEKTLYFINNWYLQCIILARVGAVVGLTYLVHTQTHTFLETSDSVWRCSVQPFFQNVLLAIFQVFRIVFDAVIPLYNYWIMILGQATQGSFAIAVKCDIVVLFDSIRLGLKIFISLFESVFAFVDTDLEKGFGYGKGIKTIRINDFNVTNATVYFQDLIVNQESTLNCICEELKPVFDLAFVFFKQVYAPRCVNHLVNIFVSILQEGLKVIPPYNFGNGQFPNFNKPVYHINGAISQAGQYVDHVMIELFVKFIDIFDADFKLPIPKVFLFGIFSHFLMGSVHLFHTFFRSVFHILVPLTEFITDSNYMMEAFSIKQAVSEFNIGITLLAEFFLEISGIVAKLLGALDMDEMLVLTTAGQAIVGTEFMIYILPYIIQYGGLSVLNLFYISYELIIEIILKGFIYQEDRVWVILQKYDGLKYPQPIITCEDRAQATWDLTNKQCKCDISDYPINYPGPYDMEKPFGELLYDPYCGQPNLQANFFSPIQALSDKLFVGPIVKLLLEIIKASLKIILNFDAIASNTYFDYPQNCGYGASNEMLEQRWETIHGNIIPCAAPNNVTHMVFDTTDSVLKSLEKYNTKTSLYGQFDSSQLIYINSTASCFPRHELIRYYDCMQQRHQKESCVEDKSSCTCPISTTEKSSCQCIHDFPDREQEIAETGYSNPIMKQLHSNENVCNSFVLEPIFEAVEDLLDDVSETFELIAKGCDTIPFIKSNAIADNKCNLYVSSNFFCSTSLSIRSLSRFIVNEVRDIMMGFFDILSDDLELTLDFSNRFCDLERSVSSVSSMIADLFGQPRHTDVIAKPIFALTVLPIRGLEFLDNILTFLLKAIQSKLTTDSFYDLLIDEIHIVFDWLILFLDGMKGITVTFVSSGAAEVFDTMIDAMNVIKNALSRLALEFAGFALKIFFDISNIVSTGKGFDTLFADVESFFGFISQLVIKATAKFFKNFLSLLGPVGTFIDNMYEQVSKGLATAGKGIENAADATWKDIKGIFGRRLRSSKHSPCDRMIHHHIRKEWDQIPFGDRLFIEQCVQQEEMAKQLSLYFGIHLPHDIISNWKRKYVILSEFMIALNVYLTNPANQMVIELKKQDVDPSWLETIQYLQSQLSIDNLNTNIQWSINQVPREYKKGYIKHAIGMYDASYSILERTTSHRRKLYHGIPPLIHNISKKMNMSIKWSFPKYYKSVPVYYKRLKAAGLISDIIPCTSKNCINCAVLNDFVDVVVEDGADMKTYYTDTYWKLIIPDFRHWWEGRAQDFAANAVSTVKMMDSALNHADHVAQRRSLKSIPNKTITNFDRAEKDWDYLFTNFELRNTNIFDTLQQFFQVTDDSYVPYFAYSLPYYVSYPLTESCPKEIIYCDYEDEYIKIYKTAQRMQLITNALNYILYFAVAVYVVDLFSSLPVLSTISPYFWIIIPSIYMFVVYRYTYTCFPNIPNCLVDDMFAYINDILFPECFCHYFPGISKSCTPATCFLCSQQTPFYSCREQIDLLDRMGYTWAPVMYLKVHFPDTMDFLYRTIPFSWMLRKLDGVGEIILNDITQIELDCMSVHTLDIGVVFVVFIGSAYLLSMFISLTIRYVQYGIQIMTMFFLAAANMSISIELSTISVSD